MYTASKNGKKKVGKNLKIYIYGHEKIQYPFANIIALLKATR